MAKSKRIFHGLVNYGTQSGTFANELRRLGYDAVSVTMPDSFNRLTDIRLKHGGNLLQKIVRHSSNYFLRVKFFFSHDIFHFYFGTTLLPKQLDLPLYRVFGKKVIMEYLGSDIQSYKKSVEQYKWTNLKYKLSLEEGLAHDKTITSRYIFESKYCDKQLVCAPCYSEFATNAEILPLAIDLSNVPPVVFPSFDGTFRIMHAPTHRGFKGSQFIIAAVQQLIKEGYPIEFDLVENVSHSALLGRYAACHLFIDQIVAGWYGTASIEAMAVGRPVVVFVRPTYLSYVEFGKKLPTISADPDNIYQMLKDTLDGGIDSLHKRGERSRTFVEEVHDVKKVTRHLLDIYRGL